MAEVLPNQDFYPFKDLKRLRPLDRKPVPSNKFTIDVARSRWKFGGINVDFRLFASSDTINNLPDSKTPLGPVPIDLDFHNGFYTVRKAPVDIFVEFRSKNLELLKNAQWYLVRFALGLHTYDVDVTEDRDIVFDGPEGFLIGEVVTLGGGIHGIALPYELAKVQQIKTRMVERELPSD